MSAAASRLPLAALLFASMELTAAEVRVAVAANFTLPMREIAAQFEAASGHRTRLSHGSSGKLYAQIVHGAPFDLLLSADAERPGKLAAAGLAERPFAYAIGRLVLWTASPDRSVGPDSLAGDSPGRVAIANPKTAPYGAAARTVITRLGLEERLRTRLVQGDGVIQTYQFVASGNVDYGFVALSQLLDAQRGSRWIVPAALHAPLRQDAALLHAARDRPAARALAAFLSGDRARAIIARFGYELPARE